MVRSLGNIVTLNFGFKPSEQLTALLEGRVDGGDASDIIESHVIRPESDYEAMIRRHFNRVPDPRVFTTDEIDGFIDDAADPTTWELLVHFLEKDPDNSNLSLSARAYTGDGKVDYSIRLINAIKQELAPTTWHFSIAKKIRTVSPYYVENALDAIFHVRDANNNILQYFDLSHLRP